ncbi:hypothetical protein H0G86_000856 [Trichoderma simmonsii]|uniref:Uncharacterized protein n=1 Tax=Trichoderma simmonsii TaxID=1491479 RepID=A0A8G0P9X0_9HYPO|nr:hypothetical protein H0G86_000856 [Trichoderma simmonsii]
MAHNVFIYLAEAHCVLCRVALPYYPGINVFRINAKDWEKDIVGLFDLAADSTNGPLVVAIKTTLKEKYPIIGTNVMVRHKGGEASITIVRERPNIKHRPFFFAHQLCVKAIESLRGGPIHEELYHLAIQTQEILPRDCWGEEPPTHLASFLSTIQSGIVDTENTDLGSCLSRCCNLPLELQAHILKYLHENGNNVVFSLMTALHTFTVGRSLLVPVLLNQPPLGDFIRVDHVDKIHICASITSVFGRSYLWGIETSYCQNHQPTPNKQCIELSLNSIRKMEFILGMYGITAVRFHMDTNLVTPWLGDARKGWRCKPIDFTRENVGFPRSGQQDLVGRFAELLLHASRKDAPLNVLWDASSRLLQGGVSFISHFYTDLPSVRPSVFPGLPMCRYLPLHLDGQPVVAITVYLFDLGTSCIVVHGKNTPRWVSVPLRKGVSRSFYFKPGEEIITLGLITTGERDYRCGPFLLFKTNLNRTAYFGPAGSLTDPTIQWVSLIPDHLNEKCTVAGLIVDQMAISYNCFRTIGAHCTPKEGVVGSHKLPTSSSGLHLVLPEAPKILRRFGFRNFAVVSNAQLYDIKHLRVLLRDARDYDNNHMWRFGGLWILHGDGSVETIGCWDESLTKYAKTIYKESDGQLTRVIFRSREGRHPLIPSEIVRYIVDITTRVVPHGSDQVDPDEEDWKNVANCDYLQHCKISYSKKITWTFTEASDHIENTSTGTTDYNLAPHRECKLLQIEQ